MVEDHAKKALCPENMQTAHQLVTRKIAYPKKLSRRMRAHINLADSQRARRAHVIEVVTAIKPLSKL
jgi:hypothetical protein